MPDVIALPHPLRTERVTFGMAPGASIDDILVELVHRADLRPEILRHAVVMVGDVKIPKSYWGRVRVKDGAEVTVKAMPGDDFASLFVSIAGFALSAFVPPIGALALGSINLGQLAVRAVISVATSLIAQAVAPSPRQTLSRSDDAPRNAAHSVQGVRNEARPYGVVPAIYGRLVNYHPPLAALPYTETKGNDQFLRMLFTCGYGPVTTSTYRVGTTAVTNLSDFDIQVRDGSGSTSTGLYPSQVFEESLQIQLTQSGGWVQRQTSLSADEVLLDVTFPSGLFRLSSRNVKFALSVQFQVQYRASGGGSWTNAPLEQASGNLALDGNGYFTVTRMSTDLVRRSVRFVLPSRGSYLVRIRRVTKDDQSEIPGTEDEYATTEDSYWTALRSLTDEDPVDVTRGLCMLAVRARASNQLNGVLEAFNMTVERRLPVWDGASWTTQATRSPVWAFCDVLRGSANARAISAARIDLDQMLEWEDYCDDKGLTFDAVVDREVSVWDLLHDIAATGHATPIYVDGKWSVAIDRPRTQIVQHFSPRNSWGFRGTRLFGDFPHALKVRFPNVATQHQTDERIVYDTGYSAATATKFEVLDLPYTTSASIAWKEGRRALAAARLRSEVFTIEADIEHIRCSRGDLVQLTHDVPLIGIGAARVSALTLDGGSNLTHVTLDAPMPMEALGSYGLRFRLADGTSVTAGVVTAAGEQTTLELSPAIASGSDMPAVGDLALFGEDGEESIPCIIRSIEPRPDFSAVITMIPYVEAVYTADSGVIPAHDPVITLPPEVNRATPAKPTLLRVASDEAAGFINNAGLVQPQILVVFEVDENAGEVRPDAVQLEYRLIPTFADGTLAEDADWTRVNINPNAGRYVLAPVQTGDVYDIRLRSVGQYGTTSEWVTHRETVTGLASLPPSIDRMFREGDYLYWQYADPPLDFAGFRVKANYGSSTNWSSARNLHSGLLSASRFDISSLDGTQTIMVKAVDVAGNESESAAVVTINLGDPITANLLLTQSEAPTFAGEKSGGTVVSNELLADTDTDPLFWGADSALFWPASGAATFWPTVTYAEMSYVASYDPTSGHLGATVRLSLDVTGEYQVDYREATSPAFWGLDASTFWGSDADPFWPDSDVGDWTTWPGQLGPLSDDTIDYDFRVTTAEGTTQGVITGFDILVDVPDITEYFEDVSIAATGTPRLSLTKTYRAIKVVNVTVQDDAGTAVTARVKDKDEALGPNIETLDASGSRAAGTIDAVVIGY